MMYLQVAHVEDNDCDLFSFSTLDNAFEYIKAEKIQDYILSDMLLEAYNQDDFTYIHVTHANEYFKF